MKFFLFFAVCIIGLGLFGAPALAQLTYEPIVQIPRLTPNTQNTEQYVNALYLLAITLAAFLAVVKIIFGGVKWMLSDVVTDKSAAKKDIKGALLGLLIVLTAVLILNTINKDLTNLDILGDSTALYNPPAQQQSAQPLTACEADQDSAACCLSQGGQHFSDVVNGQTTTRCNLGDVIPITDSGDDTQDRVNCQTGGLEWDAENGVCRTPAIQEMPLPPDSEGLHPGVACGNYGNGWEYRAETDTCINRM